MAMVVVCNAVVHPWTVTGDVSLVRVYMHRSNSLVTLCDAALTSLAMLAAQRFPDHAAYAKVVFIKLT